MERDNILYCGSIDSVYDIIRNGLAADVDGKKIFSFIMELPVEASAFKPVQTK